MNTKLALLAASAVALLAAHSAGAQTYGSASESTYRDCSGVSATQACDGTGTGQGIRATVLSGGSLSTANSDLTLSGQTLPAPFGNPGTVTVPSDGSYARSTVGFTSGLDLPVIHGSTYSNPTGQDRMNINSIGYQSYDYTGPSGVDFSLTGNLSIDNSSTDGGDGTLPGGAIYTAYVAIWDPSVLAGLTTAGDIFNSAFLADCSTAGVLAIGEMSGPLSGGPASISVTTSACGGGPLLLTTGEEVLAVAGLQLPVNRGGFADASHTYLTTLGSDLSADDKEILVAGLQSGESILGVPEPAAWALMLSGFFGMGSMLRRRRAALAV
jgi:hypothetical protein